MAGYVIHTPAGLSDTAERRAAELGPPDVTAPGSPAELARAAGFSVMLEEDVTAQFRSTCEAVLRARSRYETALRQEEGAEGFAEEQRKKQDMLQGIDEGLLLRSLIVVTRG